MRNYKLILSVILMFLMVTNSLAFSEDHWFDYYGKIPWKEEVFRLRNFETYLRRNPDAVGYIGFNWSSSDEFEEMKKRAERAQRFLICERKLDKRRIVVIEGGPRDAPRMILHILPRDEPPPDFS